MSQRTGMDLPNNAFIALTDIGRRLAQTGLPSTHMAEPFAPPSDQTQTQDPCE
jgi:hypothetical protein